MLVMEGEERWWKPCVSTMALTAISQIVTDNVSCTVIGCGALFADRNFCKIVSFNIKKGKCALDTNLNLDSLSTRRCCILSPTKNKGQS